MGRKKMSEYPPEVAARMRADLSEKKRLAWVNRESNGYGTRANGAKTIEVQERISDSVRALWAAGTYAERVNGMTGVTGLQHPGWTWGRPHFREILGQYEVPECRHCGETEGLNAHHVDESHDNYLLTNLAWYCVPCHAWQWHYAEGWNHGPHMKRPFVTIAKEVAVEYAHILPWHPGKCARLHGHSGRVTAEVRGRLDPNDTVLDFGDLGAALRVAVHDVIDHQFLNDFLSNPTSESLLVWVWDQLERVGIKGLTTVTFRETASSCSSLTAADMVEAFGWVKDESDRWVLVPKVLADP